MGLMWTVCGPDAQGVWGVKCHRVSLCVISTFPARVCSFGFLISINLCKSAWSRGSSNLRTNGSCVFFVGGVMRQIFVVGDVRSAVLMVNVFVYAAVSRVLFASFKDEETTRW